AIVISNAALVGVFYLLFQLARDLTDAASATRAVAYLAIFPTAFFLFAPYTESLFLFLTLAAFHDATRARWARASIWGALAALTRLQGVLLIVPLFYLWWKSGNAHAHKARHYAICNTYYALRLAPLALIPISTLAFLAFTNLALVSAYQSQLSARFVLPWENLAASLALIAQGGAGITDGLNLLATILFALMLVPVWKQLPREYFLFAALMFLAPLFRMTTTQPLVSMTRYALALFPVWIVWGKWGAHAWVNRAMVYPSLALLLFLSAQFFLWGWVA
ncbi:MAG: hypothetical protein HY327_02170, partial [Chloroflexi bacterium]|nr:hypothetical protein [Chloroflexota bacterium]